MRLIWARLLAAFFLLVGCFFPSVLSRAEIPQEKVVRLGYSIPDRFLNHPEEVEKSGYTYDYLQMIANYNRWRYEYVYGSWSELLKKLETGDIDMMANVSYTPERGEVYRFSDFPLRIETYYIFVPADKLSLYPSLESLAGKRIGAGANTTITQRLRNFDKEHHLGLEVVEYPSFDSRVAAMHRGEVDGIAEFTSREEIGDNLSPVAFVGSDNSFIAVTPGREDVLQDVNRALAKIHVYTPSFQADLRQKYFQHDMDAAMLTPECRIWFKAHGPIRIGYMARMVPFIWTGPDGKAKGTFRDLLDYGFRAFQLSNEIIYVPYTSHDALHEDLKAGRIDAAMPVYDTPSEAEKDGLLQTPDVVSVKMYKVSRKEELITEDTVFAVANSFPAEEKYVKDFYPHNRIIHYATPEEVFDALRRDEADAGIVNPYLISIYLTNDKSLREQELPHREDLTIAVNREQYPLYMVLSRMHTLWGTSHINESLLKHADEEYKPDFMGYVKMNYGKVIGVIFVSTLVLTLLVSMIIFRGKQKREADVLARVDLLTGLPNRRAYEEKVHEIEKNPPPFLVAVVLDINGLKNANDTRGHEAGDELIRAVGQCLRRTCGKDAYKGYTCLGYRVGGDEFVGLMHMESGAYRLLEKDFREETKKWKGKKNSFLAVSLGHASREEFPNASVSELIRLADNRMYDDKARYYHEKGIECRRR